MTDTSLVSTMKKKWCLAHALLSRILVSANLGPAAFDIYIRRQDRTVCVRLGRGTNRRTDKLHTHAAQSPYTQSSNTGRVLFVNGTECSKRQFTKDSRVVIALVLIQGIDGFHLVRSQIEIKDLTVFLHALRRTRLDQWKRVAL